MKCAIKILLEENDFIEIRGIKPPNKQWIEIQCNRSDSHSKEGEHFYKTELFSIKWEVPSNAIWMA